VKRGGWPSNARVSAGSRSTGCGSFVAILVAAGCNVREVSGWAGHNSVAYTLTRYGGLFEDGSNQAVDRLDALMQGLQGGGAVVELRRD
jgi:hypothetical protein